MSLSTTQLGCPAQPAAPEPLVNLTTTQLGCRTPACQPLCLPALFLPVFHCTLLSCPWVFVHPTPSSARKHSPVCFLIRRLPTISTVCLCRTSAPSLLHPPCSAGSFPCSPTHSVRPPGLSCLHQPTHRPPLAFPRPASRKWHPRPTRPAQFHPTLAFPARRRSLPLRCHLNRLHPTAHLVQTRPAFCHRGTPAHFVARSAGRPFNTFFSS